jgi:uncharacterized membrane protein
LISPIAKGALQILWGLVSLLAGLIVILEVTGMTTFHTLFFDKWPVFKPLTEETGVAYWLAVVGAVIFSSVTVLVIVERYRMIVERHRNGRDTPGQSGARARYEGARNLLLWSVFPVFYLLDGTARGVALLLIGLLSAPLNIKIFLDSRAERQRK